MEVSIISNLLRQRNIEPIEAGTSLDPGSYAFCTKICSKIIVAQFCIMILNNDFAAGIERPNANVNMEYGLMLGYNKYIIPFQKDDQALPFNVAGLDIINYNQGNLEYKAQAAIDIAIQKTYQNTATSPDLDQFISSFLLTQGVVVLNIDNPGDRAFFSFGNACGFSLLSNFSCNRYIYFGNFGHLRPDIALWRTEKLFTLLEQRFRGFQQRQQLGMLGESEVKALEHIRSTMEIWIMLSGAGSRIHFEQSQNKLPTWPPLKLFTLDDVWEFVEKTFLPSSAQGGSAGPVPT